MKTAGPLFFYVFAHIGHHFGVSHPIMENGVQTGPELGFIDLLHLVNPNISTCLI